MKIHKSVFQVYRACAKETERESLTGIQIRPDGSASATNGHLLIEFFPDKADAAGEQLKEPVVIPREVVEFVLKQLHYGENFVDLSSNGRVRLETPRQRIECEQAGDDFPGMNLIYQAMKDAPEYTTYLQAEPLANLALTFKELGARMMTFEFHGPTNPVSITAEIQGGQLKCALMPMRK